MKLEIRSRYTTLFSVNAIIHIRNITEYRLCEVMNLSKLSRMVNAFLSSGLTNYKYIEL